MTNARIETEADKALREYRYNVLLPEAIKEEKRNGKVLCVSRRILVIAVVYFILSLIVGTYLAEHGIEFFARWGDQVAAIPASILGAFGILGLISGSHNSVMEIVEINGEYVLENSVGTSQQNK